MGMGENFKDKLEKKEKNIPPRICVFVIFYGVGSVCNKRKIFFKTWKWTKEASLNLLESKAPTKTLIRFFTRETC